MLPSLVVRAKGLLNTSNGHSAGTALAFDALGQDIDIKSCNWFHEGDA